MKPDSNPVTSARSASSLAPTCPNLHVARLEKNVAAAELTLPGAEIARLDAHPVTGERETEMGHNG
jgi:hypothetical protein